MSSSAVLLSATAGAADGGAADEAFAGASSCEDEDDADDDDDDDPPLPAHPPRTLTRQRDDARWLAGIVDRVACATDSARAAQYTLGNRRRAAIR